MGGEDPVPRPPTTMTYTQPQLDSLHIAKRRLAHKGRPEVVGKINRMIEAEAPYADIWRVASADVEEMVKPEKPGEALLPPPRVGTGSTTAAWQEYALRVSDMEEEVVYSMGRTDLITVLEDRGIIPKEEGS